MAVRHLPLAPVFGPPAVKVAVQEVIGRILQDRPGLVSALEAGENAHAWAGDLSARVMERIPPSRPLSCAEGCDWCCHLKVSTVAPEVVRLAEYLRATKPPDELAAIRERVVRADGATRGMPSDERARARVPCPLLADGRCVAYDLRPLRCRGANSYDAAACERGFRDPDANVPLPFYKPVYQLMEAMVAGLADGAGSLGMDGTPLELNAALRIALEEPDSAKVWARGGPSFVPAHDAELVAGIQGQAPPRPGGRGG